AVDPPARSVRFATHAISRCGWSGWRTGQTAPADRQRRSGMKTFLDRLRCVLVFLPVLAALVVVPATSAGPGVVLDEPVAFGDDNPCTGEPVVFTGTVHHV